MTNYPVLRNYKFVQKYSFSQFKHIWKMHGYVFNDPRWPDGKEILTSELKNVDFEKMIIQTQHTIYKIEN